MKYLYIIESLFKDFIVLTYPVEPVRLVVVGRQDG